jgi:hypothetical protein
MRKGYDCVFVFWTAHICKYWSISLQSALSVLTVADYCTGRPSYGAEWNTENPRQQVS